MRTKKFQWFIIIPIIVLFAILFCLFMPKMINFINKFLDNNAKNNFIIDVKNINNLASAYFLRNLNPKIDVSEPNEGFVNIDLLTESNNKYIDYEGQVKIVIVNNNTNYYVNISNNKYYYSGNIKDLILENIKER